MKAAAAIMGGLVGLGLVALIGYFLVPRFLPNASPLPSAPTAPPAGPDGPPHPGQSVPVPTTSAEQLRQELSDKRVPFFRYLRHDWSGVVDELGVTGDLDTLDLAVKRSDDATLQDIVSRAISPTARDYGFRRVRFLVRSPVGSVEPLHVVAEATCDPDGRWTIYKK